MDAKLRCECFEYFDVVVVVVTAAAAGGRGCGMFAQREKYYGDRSRVELVKFALEHVRAAVVELWSGNFKSRVTEDDDPATSNLPWLISYCTMNEGVLRFQPTVVIVQIILLSVCVPSVLCHCWLGIRKGTLELANKIAGLF